jgi:hypothetical protein
MVFSHVDLLCWVLMTPQGGLTSRSNQTTLVIRQLLSGSAPAVPNSIGVTRLREWPQNFLGVISKIKN